MRLCIDNTLNASKLNIRSRNDNVLYYNNNINNNNNNNNNNNKYFISRGHSFDNTSIFHERLKQ